jgi:hypothetical protein
MDISKLDPRNPSLLEAILPHKRKQYQQYRQQLYIKFWQRSVGLRQGSNVGTSSPASVEPLQSNRAAGKATATCSARMRRLRR